MIYKGYKIDLVHEYSNGQSDFHVFGPDAESGTIEPRTSLDRIISEIDEEVGAVRMAPEMTGLSKREYIAIEAMKGMLSNPTLSFGHDFQSINAKAIACANDLLRQITDKKSQLL